MTERAGQERSSAQKEADRRYYAKHKEDLKARRKLYQPKEWRAPPMNPEQLVEAKKRYSKKNYETHKDYYLGYAKRPEVKERARQRYDEKYPKAAERRKMREQRVCPGCGKNALQTQLYSSKRLCVACYNKEKGEKVCMGCGKNGLETTFHGAHSRCTPCRHNMERDRREARGLSRNVRKHKTVQNGLCADARKRGRKSGLGGDIKSADLDWPQTCPILGAPLDYDTKPGKRGDIPHKNLPSLDRWDNTKGYFKGNVYVISLRANELKRDANVEELVAVLNYAQHGVIQW